MPRHVGWARCLDNVADVLRRGAWYPILEETPDGKVVIEVRQKPVRLSRVDVRVREVPPDRWSVVVRTGVLRPTLGGGKTWSPPMPSAPTATSARTSPDGPHP